MPKQKRFNNQRHSNPQGPQKPDFGISRKATTHGSKASLAKSALIIFIIIGLAAIVVAALTFLGLIWSAILSMAVTALLVFILKGSVEFFESKGVHRGLGTLIMFLVAIGVVAIILIIFIPMLIEQLTNFVNLLPNYYQQAQAAWSDFVETNTDFFSDSALQNWVDNFWASTGQMISGLTSSTIRNAFDAGNSIANTIMIGAVSIVASFWVLLDYNRIRKELRILIGQKFEKEFVIFNEIISRVSRGYIRGTIIGAIITGCLATLGFWLIGLPYPAVFGLILGICTIVPYVGPFFGGVVIAIFAIFTSPLVAILSIIISTVATWVVGTFISPRIMSETVNLHPGIVLIALIAGGAIGGMIGMVLAIPITAVAKDIAVYYFEKKTGRQLVSPNGALFKGIASKDVDPISDATSDYLDNIRIEKELYDYKRGLLPPKSKRKRLDNENTPVFKRDVSDIIKKLRKKEDK